MGVLDPYWPLAPSSIQKQLVARVACATDLALNFRIYIACFNLQSLGLQEINRFRVFPDTPQVAFCSDRLRRLPSALGEPPSSACWLSVRFSGLCVCGSGLRACFGLRVDCVRVWCVDWPSGTPTFSCELRWDLAVPYTFASLLSALPGVSWKS